MKQITFTLEKNPILITDCMDEQKILIQVHNETFTIHYAQIPVKQLMRLLKRKQEGMQYTYEEIEFISSYIFLIVTKENYRQQLKAAEYADNHTYASLLLSLRKEFLEKMKVLPITQAQLEEYFDTFIL